ncbi:hypothetical protein OAS86_02205 [Gammaproteobacteria bacterium]|nr:hypothetical protein [Gammaproteobacteria bacterium]
MSKPQRNSSNPYERTVIAVDRNRWFLICIVLSFILAFVIVDNIRLRKDRSDVDVAWVKVFPNGTWDIDIDQSQNKPEFFRSTVNKLLTDFVKNRYQVHAETIATDYGGVLPFLSAHLKREFLNADQAANFAADASSCKADCERIDVTIKNIEHYEIIPNSIDNSKVYRTNIFIEQIGNLVDAPTRVASYIIFVEWRILTKQAMLNKFPDIKTDSEQQAYLRVNPIGLEVINYEKQIDPTSIDGIDN